MTDITIIGAGLKQYAQMTLEALNALRAARVIFHSGFNGDVGTLANRWNPSAELRNLDAPEYSIGTYRPDMYARMAASVVDEARHGPGVVVLQPGSALVVDSVTEGILRGAAEQALRVVVIAGISCIESVLAEVGYDAGAGLQVIQAQRLVLHGHRLNPALAALVIQPGYYDTRWWAGIGLSAAERFDALQHHLLRSHDAASVMALVLSPIEPGQVGSVLWFELGDLPALHRVLSPFHTLFIPPRDAGLEDASFRARIDSWQAAVASFERDAEGTPITVPFARAWDPAAEPLPAPLAARARELAARWASRLQTAGAVPSRNSPTSPSAK